MSDILLTILIPSYNYKIGIDRILNTLQYHERIEIIIFDNSTGDSIQDLVQSFKIKFPTNLIYKHYFAENAVSNWNNLLRESKGKYYTLLHHDENIVLNTTLNNFINYLENSIYDILIFKCFIINRRARLHFPLLLTSLFLKRYPSYILRRNFIGPTACLFIKNDYFNEYFNDNLKWFVDVDFYYRLFKNINKSDYSNLITIHSYQDNINSITKKLTKDLSKIKKQEIFILRYKHNFINLQYNIIEIFIWYTFKLFYYPFSFLIIK